MWRARTDGDDRPSRGDGARSDNGARSGQDRGSTGWPTDDPRSELTGRKIRRIESAPPGSERSRPGRSGQPLARRGSNGSDGPPDGSGPADARSGRPLGAPGPDDNSFGFDDAGLPPLRQPSGEVPAVPASPSEPTDPGAAGVFGSNPSGLNGGHSIDSAAPSALSANGRAGEPFGVGGRGNGRSSESFGAVGNGRSSESFGAVGNGRSSESFGAVGNGRSGPVPSAFPDLDDAPSADSFPSWSASSPSGSGPQDATQAMAPVGGRGERTGTMPRTDDRPPSGLSGAGSSGARAGAGVGAAAAAHRLQETEIKLGGRREPVKPREPNRLLLFGALALVVLAGAAVAWWLTRDGDETAQTADGEVEAAQTDSTDPAAATETATDATTAEPEPAAAEPLLDVPVLSLVGVEPGPLDPAGTYSIDLQGEAPGALLQVVVDGVPQGEPGPVLPDLILPTGRHTLLVNITDGGAVTSSTPVEVYVLGQPPVEVGDLANLASVDIVNEGWDEAIRRFDGFRADGHEGLQLLPITPGYWNIFVAGLGDAETVAAYCESFGLAVPDDCFAKPFDPATYQSPVAPAPAAAEADGAEGDDGAMTDETGTEGDDGAMTDETGAETSTTTTAGG